jgi:carbamate kinase
MSKPLAVVAVGGNALILDASTQRSDQYDAVCATATHVAAMVAAGWNVVLTHGNGPQVGFILRRSEIADGQVPTVPVQYAVGDTQGAIGSFRTRSAGRAGPRVPVMPRYADARRPQRPRVRAADKPIGSFASEEVATSGKPRLTVMADSNRGWRRTIASPQPKRVIESPLIGRLAREGTVVVACGGGGIAVEDVGGGRLRGVEAVIDKDRASALLAIELDADLLIIPTGVERVASAGQPISGGSTAPRRGALLRCRGHFGEGSMAPKIEVAEVRRRPAWRARHHQRQTSSAHCAETGTWIEG